MSNNHQSVRHSAKLEDLVALNDEITALVRAGVPLELGLRQIGRDLRGSLGRIAAALGTRMSAGESLTEAMQAESKLFPSMYRAVVEAGLQAGRLPAALEAITRYAQSLLEVHRRVSLACAYPLIVFLAAYSLFLLMLTEMVPRFEMFFTTFRMPEGTALRWLQTVARSMPYWGATIPIVLLLVIGYWIFFQRRAMLNTGTSLSLFRFFPWTSGIARDLRIANFSDLLALLTTQGVPLQKGLALAARGTGQRALIKASETIAARLQRGDSFSKSIEDVTTIPPYLRWLIQSGEQQGTLAVSLNRAAEVYRSRAVQRLDAMKIMLPLVIVVVIGGGSTLLYAFTLFGPLIETLRSLALP